MSNVNTMDVLFKMDLARNFRTSNFHARKIIISGNFLKRRKFSHGNRLQAAGKFTIQDKAKVIHKCTFLPGDTFGIEAMAAVEKIIQVTKIPIEFEKMILSENNPKANKLDDIVRSVLKNKMCLMGFIDSKHNVLFEHETVKLQFRKRLDLYANVIHMKNVPGVNTKHKDFDVVLIREQTEGEYSSLEYESKPGVVEAMKIMTDKKCKKIAKFAFDYAMKFNRKKITIVHKANIMKLADGLFMRSCYNTSKLYPVLECDDIIVDNLTMQIVRNPQVFDVLVMPNLYGSILANIACGIMGGGGVTPATWYSRDCAVFTPGARSINTRQLGGKSENPVAMILCCVNMLTHLNYLAYSKWLKNAVFDVLRQGNVRTPDIGGKATTSQFTNAVIGRMMETENTLH